MRTSNCSQIREHSCSYNVLKNILMFSENSENIEFYILVGNENRVLPIETKKVVRFLCHFFSVPVTLKKI